MANNNEQRILQLKSTVDTLTAKHNKAKWAVESVEKELLEKFGIKSIEEAKAEAKKAEEEAKKAEREVEEELARIEEEYGDLLELADES
jgi:hypothetical protein